MELKKRRVFSSMALAVGGFVFFAAQSVAFAGSYTSAGTGYTGTEEFPGTSGSYLATVATYTGKGPGGQYAGQGISAFEPVSGSGCNMIGSLIAQANCPIDGRTDGCLYQAIGGASENTYQGPFDVETFERVTGSESEVCIDFSSTSGPPYNTLGTMVDQRTGGTGRFKNKKGKITTAVHGQIMTMDSAGNGFSWYRSVGN
jgi:hypothetical protein